MKQFRFSFLSAAATTRAWRWLVSLALAALVAGCSDAKLMTDAEIAANPRMQIVHRDFAQAIEDAKNDPSQSWYSGWFGNSIVNFWGGSTKGLCYHWQQRIYAAMRQKIEALGLRATGIMINRAHSDEHHCVLVFDPSVIDEASLLTQPMPLHGWVLDAWNRGQPDIYTLDEWHKLPMTLRRDWELQDLCNIADLPARGDPETSPPLQRMWEREGPADGTSTSTNKK